MEKYLLIDSSQMLSPSFYRTCI